MQGSPAPVDILRAFVPQQDGRGAPVAGRDEQALASVGGDFSGILAMLVAPQSVKSTPAAQGGPQPKSPASPDAGVVEVAEADETHKAEVIGLPSSLLIQGILPLPPQAESALVLPAPPGVQRDTNVPATAVGTTASTSQTVPAASGEPAGVRLAENLLATTTAAAPDEAKQPLPKQPAQPRLETRPEQILTPEETAPEPSSEDIPRALPEQTDQPISTPVVLDKAVPKQVTEASSASVPNAGVVNRPPVAKPAVEPSLPPNNPSRAEVRTAAAPQQAQQPPQVTEQASVLVVPVLPSANPQRDVPTEAPVATSTATIKPLPDVVPETSKTAPVTFQREPARSRPGEPAPPAQPVTALEGHASLTSTATVAVTAQETPAIAATVRSQGPIFERSAGRPQTVGDSVAVDIIDSSADPQTSEAQTAATTQRPQEQQQRTEGEPESTPARPSAPDAAVSKLSSANTKRSEAVYRQVARDASPNPVTPPPTLPVAGVEWNPPLDTHLKGKTNSSNAATTGVDGVSIGQTGAATTAPTGMGMPAVVAPTSSLISSPDLPQIRSDFVAQAVTLIQSAPAGDEQRVMMRLDPPELGRVLIRIRRSSESLSVHIESDSARTLSVLREQHGQLVDSLTSGMSNSGQIDLSYSDGQQQEWEQAEERMPQLTLFPIDSEAGGSEATVPARQELSFVA